MLTVDTLTIYSLSEDPLKVGGWGGGVVGPCDFSVTPVPIGLGFGSWTALGLGLRGLDFPPKTGRV